tara:strand:+ start:6083 stop:6838 length:756 start_codon:yes stop_codon:yes gene_type:complete
MTGRFREKQGAAVASATSEPRWGEFRDWQPTIYYPFDADASDHGPRGLDGALVTNTIDASVKKLGDGSLKGAAGGYTTIGSDARKLMVFDDNSWAFMTWFKCNAIPSHAVALVTRWASRNWSTDSRNVEIEPVTGNLNWNLFGQASVQIKASVADDAWHHLALVRDTKDTSLGASEMAVWFDGSQEADITITAGDANYADDVELCTIDASESSATFHMDDTAYFTYPISGQYITACYNSGAGAAANLAGLN